MADEVLAASLEDEAEDALCAFSAAADEESSLTVADVVAALSSAVEAEDALAASFDDDADDELAAFALSAADAASELSLLSDELESAS